MSLWFTLPLLIYRFLNHCNACVKIFSDTMTKSVTEDFRILSTILNFHKDSYNLDVKINELLLALKYFCTEICQSPIFCGEFEFEEKEAYSWGSAYLEKLGITLIMMCEQLKEIFSQEPRLLRLSSPVYIMGLYSQLFPTF